MERMIICSENGLFFPIKDESRLHTISVFCCHFCHPFLAFNSLNINSLHEVLKVTATKNKT